jgi:hypothetical protein
MIYLNDNLLTMEGILGRIKQALEAEEQAAKSAAGRGSGAGSSSSSAATKETLKFERDNKYALKRLGNLLERRYRDVLKKDDEDAPALEVPNFSLYFALVGLVKDFVAVAKQGDEERRQGAQTILKNFEDSSSELPDIDKKFHALDEHYGYFGTESDDDEEEDDEAEQEDTDDEDSSLLRKQHAKQLFEQLAKAIHFQLTLFEKHDDKLVEEYAYHFAYKLMVLFVDQAALDRDDFDVNRQFAEISAKTAQLMDIPNKKRKPLHDTLIDLEIPEEDDVEDLAGWQALIQENPTEALRYFEEAPRIEDAIAAKANINTAGKTPDEIAEERRAFLRAPKTLSEAKAIFDALTYPRQAENLAFAKLCARYKVSNKRFEAALDYIKTGWPKKTEDNLPDVSFQETINNEVYCWVKLPPTDKRALIMGDITTCCQSIDGESAECVKDSVARSDNGVYVLLRKKKRADATPIINNNGVAEINDTDFNVVGQSYTWMSSTGNVCLDSFEGVTSLSPEVIQRMTDGFASRARQINPGIKRATLGMGGNTPRGIFPETSAAEKMRQGTFYGDAKNQYLIQSKGLPWTEQTQQKYEALCAENKTEHFKAALDYILLYLPSDESISELLDALKNQPELASKLTLGSVQCLLLLTKTPSPDTIIHWLDSPSLIANTTALEKLLLAHGSYFKQEDITHLLSFDEIKGICQGLQYVNASRHFPLSASVLKETQLPNGYTFESFSKLMVILFNREPKGATPKPFETLVAETLAFIQKFKLTPPETSADCIALLLSEDAIELYNLGLPIETLAAIKDKDKLEVLLSLNHRNVFTGSSKFRRATGDSFLDVFKQLIALDYSVDELKDINLLSQFIVELGARDANGRLLSPIVFFNEISATQRANIKRMSPIITDWSCMKDTDLVDLLKALDQPQSPLLSDIFLKAYRGEFVSLKELSQVSADKLVHLSAFLERVFNNYDMTLVAEYERVDLIFKRLLENGELNEQEVSALADLTIQLLQFKDRHSVNLKQTEGLSVKGLTRLLQNKQLLLQETVHGTPFFPAKAFGLMHATAELTEQSYMHDTKKLGDMAVFMKKLLDYRKFMGEYDLKIVHQDSFLVDDSQYGRGIPHNKLCLKSLNGKLVYSVKTPDIPWEIEKDIPYADRIPSEVADQPTDIDAPDPLTIEALKQVHQQILEIALSRKHIKLSSGHEKKRAQIKAVDAILDKLRGKPVADLQVALEGLSLTDLNIAMGRLFLFTQNLEAWVHELEQTPVVIPMTDVTIENIRAGLIRRAATPGNSKLILSDLGNVLRLLPPQEMEQLVLGLGGDLLFLIQDEASLSFMLSHLLPKQAQVVKDTLDKMKQDGIAAITPTIAEKNTPTVNNKTPTYSANEKVDAFIKNCLALLNSSDFKQGIYYKALKNGCVSLTPTELSEIFTALNDGKLYLMVGDYRLSEILLALQPEQIKAVLQALKTEDIAQCVNPGYFAYEFAKFTPLQITATLTSLENRVSHLIPNRGYAYGIAKDNLKKDAQKQAFWEAIGARFFELPQGLDEKENVSMLKELLKDPNVKNPEFKKQMSQLLIPLYLAEWCDAQNTTQQKAQAETGLKACWAHVRNDFLSANAPESYREAVEFEPEIFLKVYFSINECLSQTTGNATTAFRDKVHLVWLQEVLTGKAPYDEKKYKELGDVLEKGGAADKLVRSVGVQELLFERKLEGQEPKTGPNVASPS